MRCSGSFVGVSLLGLMLAQGCGPATGDGGNEGSSGGDQSIPGQTGSTTTTSPTPTNTGGATGATGSGGGDDSGSSGDPPVLECAVDDDCVLIDRCFSCGAGYGGGNGAPGPADSDLLGGGVSLFDIGESCERTQCELWGNPVAVCRFGQCALSKLHCGQPACDSLPPDCDPPFVPLVDPDLSCWTGTCGPGSLCEYVEDCITCETAGQLCVWFEGEVQATCEEAPVECDGSAECDCAGAVFCGDAPCSTNDEGIVCG